MEVDGRPLTLPTGRPRELLVWLAANPGAHPRISVASAFWPEVADSTALASLRTALWSLRRSLGEAAHALRTEPTHVELGSEVWVDLRVARQLWKSGRPAEALSLADGEVAPGVVGEWADRLREDHRRMVLAMLEELAAVAEAVGDHVGAADLTRRQARIDGLSETVHRAYLTRLAAAGNFAAAAEVHSVFRRHLWEELRVVPSPATTALVDRLRAGTDRATEGHLASAGGLPPRLHFAEREPFVGRSTALGMLRDAWCAAHQQLAPALVLITGEAGIGKTRLAAHFAARLADRGTPVLFGAAAEDGLVPAEPFVEALGLDGAAPVAELIAAVHDRLSATVTAGGTTVLVLDDLHWADSVTFGVLRRVLRSIVGERLFVLGCYREPDERSSRVAAAVTELTGACMMVRILLTGLSAAETKALLQTNTDSTDDEAAVVHARTDGNPLFVSEMAAFLAAGDSGSGSAALPESVRQIVSGRMARCSPAAADLVATAAVAGPKSSTDLLRAAIPNSAVVTNDLVAPLEELLNTGLVVEPQPGALAFRHAVVRDAVYGALSLARRSELHRAVADALEAGHEEDGPHLLDIALHRCAATPTVGSDRAVADAERAAAWAVGQNAYDQAVVVLTRALEVAAPADRPRLRVRRAVAYQRLTHRVIDPADL